MSKITNNDLRESQRMLIQHPRIIGALKTLTEKEEYRKQDRRVQYENAKTDGAREYFRWLIENVNHELKEPQRMMYLHITGSIDWNQTHEQIANKFGFSKAYIKQLSGYLQHQEIMSSVIGWDHLIDLMIFVIKDHHGCSIRNFYDLFREIKKYPRKQWSDIMDRVIQEIQSGKRIKYIIENLGLK